MIHDLLYRTGGRGLPGSRLAAPPYTRADSDAVFKDAMQALGVSSWKVFTIYAAVRAFGASSWKGA